MAQKGTTPLEKFKKHPKQSWFGYIKHLVRISPFVFMKIRLYGIRYYRDPEYYALMRRRQKDARRRQVYGSGYLSRKRKVKAALVSRDGCWCALCHNRFLYSQLTIDHVVQRYKGGSNNLNNLQLLCLPCHKQKDSPYVHDASKAYGFFPFREALEKIKLYK